MSKACFYCRRPVSRRRVAVCQVLAHMHCLKVAMGYMDKPKKWPDDWNKRCKTPEQEQAHLDPLKQACEIMVEREQQKWLALQKIVVKYIAETKCVEIHDEHL